MMRRRLNARLTCNFGMLLCAAAWLAAQTSIAQNLPGELRLHDPSTVVECDGRHMLFFTGRGIASNTSSDLLHWTEGPPVFAASPPWTTNAVPANRGRFWAPDVAFFNNRYPVYYSVSSFGSQRSAIGLVTNLTLDPTDPKYAWTDFGPVIESNPGSAYNVIDPSIIQTASGKVWMSFGSFWDGIFLIALDPATGLRLPKSEPQRLAHNSSIEAPFIYERDGNFYLFVNWGLCCRGVTSTYNIRVGRSDRITEPYRDRRGVDMVAGGGTLFLATEGNFVGPGHISIFSHDQREWFGYHYYDRANRGISKYDGRALDRDEVGWPEAGPAISLPKIGSHSIEAALISLMPVRRFRQPSRNL